MPEWNCNYYPGGRELCIHFESLCRDHSSQQKKIEGLVHVPLLPRAQEDNQQHHSYYDYTNNFKGHGSGHAVHKGKISIMMTMQNDNEYINPN